MCFFFLHIFWEKKIIKTLLKIFLFQIHIKVLFCNRIMGVSEREWGKVIVNKKKHKGKAVFPSPLEVREITIQCFSVSGYHEITKNVITVLSSQS